MFMKQCNKCGQEKQLTEYNSRQAQCRQCQKIYDKKVRLSKPEYFKEYNKEWSKSNPTYVKNKYHSSIPAGVYMIKCLTNGKRYIGQSVKPYRRLTQHFSNHSDSNTKYTNVILQQEYQQYGKQSFVFGIIEHCPPEQLLQREQYYINQFQPEYNLLK